MPRPQMIDHPAELRRIDRIARLLDARFSVLGIRFGYDSILGLVPGLGDMAAALPAAWMIWTAHRLGISRGALLRMLGNAAVDFGVGSVPVIGDVFDVAFKGNLRNARILRDEVERMARDVQV